MRGPGWKKQYTFWSAHALWRRALLTDAEGLTRWGEREEPDRLGEREEPDRWGEREELEQVGRERGA